MKDKLLFLTSVRFYAVVLIAIIGVLKVEGIIPDDIATALVTILGGYTVIRTVDRASETLAK